MEQAVPPDFSPFAKAPAPAPPMSVDTSPLMPLSAAEERIVRAYRQTAKQDYLEYTAVQLALRLPKSETPE